MSKPSFTPGEVIDQFHKCCETIIEQGTGPKASKALKWAVNYALYGTGVTLAYEVRVQALYILNNITHWRGPIAKAVRTDLKQIVKQLS